ncbi:MAG: Do family serine endopeptidase [Hyphomicrobiaceae bacterium]
MAKTTCHNNSAKHGPTGSARIFVRGFAVAAILGGAILALPFAPNVTTAGAELRPDPATIGKIVVPGTPGSFADLVDQVKPTVVSISVESSGSNKKTAQKRGQPKGKGGKGQQFSFPNLPDDHPLNEFFKNLPKGQQLQPQRPSQAQGSGFVISEDGYVVTNNHVIDGADKIQVNFDGNKKFDAELIGTDARTDLALLKIKKSGPFPYVKFADETPRVGDWVVAVGNPFGLGGTVTAGILSAKGRDIGSGPYDFLQIDAAVNRGNSGGPTFDLQGRVIGVNTAIFSPSGGNVGIAFAVPANTAREVIKQLRESGTVSRGWLGVKIQNVDEDTAASLGLAEAKGALVSDVTKSGPAEAAGLKMQDAILSVDEQDIIDSRDLARKIAQYAPNSMVDVGIWRNSAKQKIKVKLGRFPTSQAELAALQNGSGPGKKKIAAELQRLGLTLVPARVPGKDGGVAIAEVAPDSDAARKGLKPGDVILEVQGVSVTSQADVVKGVKSALELSRRAVLLHLKSGEQKRFVAIQLSKKEK